MKVVVGGIGDRLPALFRAYQDDAAFPDLVPGAPVLVAQPLKAALGGHAHQPGRLAIRLVVHLTGDKTRELMQDVGTAGSRLEAVRGRQRRQLVVFLAPALDAVAPVEPRDVGGATGRKPSVRFPQHRTVHHRRIRDRGRCLAPSPAPHDPVWTDLAGDHQPAGPVDPDLDLLEHHRWQRSAAERQDLDRSPRLTAVEREAAGELTAGEVVALLDELRLSGHAAQPAAVYLDLAADRVRAA